MDQPVRLHPRVSTIGDIDSIAIASGFVLSHPGLLPRATYHFVTVAEDSAASDARSRKYGFPDIFQAGQAPLRHIATSICRRNPFGMGSDSALVAADRSYTVGTPTSRARSWAKRLGNCIFCAAVNVLGWRHFVVGL
ncbi:hypothetical protein CONLIGDRAFT_649072 [Coniochaeta ligniaria NRRL 30616]|uniref:Uncharacterized protein n=1 Tax=Coniochaeta ligniaria NRRL 30616 TaxID=1408157 RepID=A0A1J7I9K5_9PEZI|nr:hypothetical protein CONLIGDRAFT_649072 [Coniochaeta ligniaria NRRL 30616]